MQLLFSKGKLGEKFLIGFFLMQFLQAYGEEKKDE